jgi:hypothetical protein
MRGNNDSLEKAIKKADEQNEIKYWKFVSLASKIKFGNILKID